MAAADHAVSHSHPQYGRVCFVNNYQSVYKSLGTAKEKKKKPKATVLPCIFNFQSFALGTTFSWPFEDRTVSSSSSDDEGEDEDEDRYHDISVMRLPEPSSPPIIAAAH